jgi:selenocysteine-specific elongation factor
MIVATAGHIDHGKTLLVKALTGVDTDRLPEEKARGISIDLGFAYLPLDARKLIGFVDVPGHERFIRNMLAGVCGIDFALLVVAADDGVMPQTLEHLHILDLLHVRRGAVAITKSDRVEASRVREVEQQVGTLIGQTQLAGAPILAVSAISGVGIDQLRALLVNEAGAQAERNAQGGHFRYAVDRAFTVAGSGTVVTGTVFAGSVKAGDRVVVSPDGLEVRVRSIQIHGKAADSANSGERCALNLTGADVASIGRGDWVLAPVLHKPTQRIDARVKVLSAEEGSLEHWTPVHLHLATSDVTGRIATRRGASIAPGDTAIVQLALDEPIGALRGDRFIIRDQSASRTLGGGIVLDPFAPATRRSTAARQTELSAFDCDAPEEALAILLQSSERPIDLTRFEVVYNLASEHAAGLYQAQNVTQLGKESRLAITRARFDKLREAVLHELDAFHKRQPQAPGYELDALRAIVSPFLSLDAFATLIRTLVDERKIEASGSTAKLAGHNTTANAADERMWQLVRPALEAAAFNPPPLRELAIQLKLKEAVLKDFLHRKAKSGEVLKVTADRFYTRGSLASLAALAQTTAAAQPAGQFTAAQYRDASGLGRSLAIEILECLDRLGITQRIGDARKMRKDFVPILGAADTPQRPPASLARAAPAPRRPTQSYRR